MALSFQKLIFRNAIYFSKVPIRLKSQRRSLGKPPGVAKTLAQRLEEMDSHDPAVYYKVNIGFSRNKLSRKEVLEKRVEHLRRNKADRELELAARKNTLNIPLEEVEQEWSKNEGPEHIRVAAEHYGIFEHLFGDGYFLPVVNLEINYNYGENQYPVCRGNLLKPEMSVTHPEVSFESNSESLWSLLMTTPDGHLEGGEKEYAHWLIGNIKGNDISSGETIFRYVQPFPMKGLGYLRYIFLLFKQEEPMDFSALKESASELELSDRTFSTYNFYRKRESQITPAGLAWFQADWDTSVTAFFHEQLKYDEEPVFIYDFPEPYRRKQEWFPIRKPFNLYLDRYRDEKEIAKEYLIRKLKPISPFSPPSKPLHFPNAVPFKKGTPSWLKTELRKRRMGVGRAFDYK